jgi:cell division protein FtsN
MAARRGGKTQAKRGGGMKTGLILVAGLVLGLGLAAAYLMFGDRQKLDAILPQPNAQAEAPAPRREAEPVAQEPEAPAESPKPTYDFYTVLPEKEVELPGESAQAATPPSAAANPTNAATAGSATVAPTATPSAAASAAQSGLQLQAGAFSNASDAEALRARLALVGQTARIETVQTNGRTLHRVRLGPYADAAARDAAQNALAEAGVTATPAR